MIPLLYSPSKSPNYLDTLHHDLLIYSNSLFLSTQPNRTLVDFDSMYDTFLKIQLRALHILSVVTLNTCIGGIHSSVSIQWVCDQYVQSSDPDANENSTTPFLDLGSYY